MLTLKVCLSPHQFSLFPYLLIILNSSLCTYWTLIICQFHLTMSGAETPIGGGKLVKKESFCETKTIILCHLLV